MKTIPKKKCKVSTYLSMLAFAALLLPVYSAKNYKVKIVGAVVIAQDVVLNPETSIYSFL